MHDDFSFTCFLGYTFAKEEVCLNGVKWKRRVLLIQGNNDTDHNCSLGMEMKVLGVMTSGWKASSARCSYSLTNVNRRVCQCISYAI